MIRPRANVQFLLHSWIVACLEQLACWDTSLTLHTATRSNRNSLVSQSCRTILRVVIMMMAMAIIKTLIHITKMTKIKAIMTSMKGIMINIPNISSNNIITPKGTMMNRECFRTKFL